MGISNVIKVLQFPIGNRKGGKTQYVLSNWKFINRRKFQFDFAVMDAYVSFEEDLLRQGCKLYHIPHYAEDDEQGFYNSFRSIVEAGRYDAVHLHTSFWKNWTAEQAAKDAGIRRIIVHAHSTRIGTGSMENKEEDLRHHQRMVADLQTDMATDYWACSQPAADFLFGDRIPQDRIRIMPNAIEIERFIHNASKRKKIRAMLGIECRFVLGHVGRLAYPKNQLFMLRVIKTVHKYNPAICMLFVGEGEDREILQDYVKKAGLKDYVIFAGFRNDIENMLQAVDLFVMPSFFEGFPLALLEAQAAGLHCYVSDSVTKETNVANHVTFLPLDETIWVEKILEASRRPYTRENMYDIMTEAGFNIKYQIKELEKGYRGEL